MKFIKAGIILCLMFFSNCRSTNSLENFPDYRMIKRFSKRLATQENLHLSCYGAHPERNDAALEKYGKGLFDVSYFFHKKRKDNVSLDEARIFLVSIAESFMKEINSDQEVMSLARVSPVTHEWIEVALYFKDENKIDLGQGIAQVHFYNGKIKYESYNIFEYTGKFPADGKHFLIHEESYEEALKIVQEQGRLKIY